jgi:hypothetical protein
VSAHDEAMPGSHAANQSKTEPMPPTQDHADPDAAPEPSTVEVPDLDRMNVGAADPQAASHPAVGRRAPVPSVTPALGATAQDSSGAAYRAPGSLGTTGPDEQIETDVERSARNVDTAGASGAPSGPGDAAGVPVVSGEAAPGSSEGSAVAQGTRTPL